MYNSLKRTQQPANNTRQSNAFDHSFLYNAADKDIAIVSGQADIIIGADAYETNQAGISKAYSGSEGLIWNNSVSGNDPIEATMWAVIPKNEFLAGGTIISQSKDYTPLFRIFTNTSPDRYGAQFRGSASTSLIYSDTVLDLSRPVVVVVTYNAGSGEKAIFIDGLKHASDNTDIGSISLTKTTLGVLSRDANDNFFAGNINAAGIINRALTDAEVYSLSSNVYQCFVDRRTKPPLISLGLAQPILSSAAATYTSTTTADFSVDTDAAGEFYYVVSTSQLLTTSDILADAGLKQLTIASAGTISFSETGLVDGATNYLNCFLRDAASADSNVINEQVVSIIIDIPVFRRRITARQNR